MSALRRPDERCVRPEADIGFAAAAPLEPLNKLRDARRMHLVLVCIGGQT
jgi:hypothetical protein